VDTEGDYHLHDDIFIDGMDKKSESLTKKLKNMKGRLYLNFLNPESKNKILATIRMGIKNK